MLSALSATAVVAAVAVAVVAPGRRYVAVAAAVAAGISLAVSVENLARGSGRSNEVLLVEDVAMIALIFMVVRYGTARRAAAAAALAVVAGVMMIVPDPPPDDPLAETLAGIGFWLLFGLGAIGAAMYVNALHAGRARSVAEARRTQRLELARDLHDFVAHDVSGIVVQAQAGQVVAHRDPTEAVAALERIEEAGLSALSSLDRSLFALREVDEATPDGDEGSGRPWRRYGLEDLVDLTARFAATGGAEVRLTFDPEGLSEVAPEVGETAYRVVAEALTNVRRHAPSATRVDVAARQVGEAAESVLVLTIADDGAARGEQALGPVGRRGGFGLIGLRERVERLGGMLTAGTRERDAGWVVRAVLPRAGGAGERAPEVPR
jgi:signal transduction histidine kinase